MGHNVIHNTRTKWPNVKIHKYGVFLLINAIFYVLSTPQRLKEEATIPLIQLTAQDTGARHSEGSWRGGLIVEPVISWLG